MPRSKQSVELGAILYRYVTGRSGGGGAVPPPPRGAGDRSLRRSTATQVGGLLPRSSSDKKVFCPFVWFIYLVLVEVINRTLGIYTCIYRGGGGTAPPPPLRPVT